MFRHPYATVTFTFCLTALLVLISITMSERRGVRGGGVGWRRACARASRFFHSWGDALASRAKPCQCNKVLYTVESSASPVIRLLAGSTLGEASSAVVVRLHTQCKGLHCNRGAKESPDLWSRSENKANQYSAHACSPFTFTASSSRKSSVDFSPLYIILPLCFCQSPLKKKIKYFTDIEIKVNFDLLTETYMWSLTFYFAKWIFFFFWSLVWV